MALKPYDGDFDPIPADEPPKLKPFSGDFTPIPRPTQAAPAAPDIPRPSGLLRRVVGDTAVDVGKGVVDLGESAVGLLDLPTGGHVGKGLESIGFRPDDARDALSGLYSPERQAANQVVQDTKGFLPTLKAMVQNPSTIAGAVAESAPSTLAGGAGIARSLAPKLTSLLGKAAPVVAGGIGEGAIQAGSSAEQSRRTNDDRLLTGKQTVAAVGSGAIDALISSVGGATAQKLGIADIDTLLAGGKTAPGNKLGILKRALGGVVQEGVLEELPQSAQEQMWQNYATGKPLMEGVPEAAAQGAIVGAAQGGATSAVVGRRKDDAPRDTSIDVTPVADPAPVVAPAAPTQNGQEPAQNGQIDPAQAAADMRVQAAIQAAGINPNAGTLSRAAARAVEQAVNAAPAVAAEPGSLAAAAVPGSNSTPVEPAPALVPSPDMLASPPVILESDPATYNPPANMDPATGELLPPDPEQIIQTLAQQGRVNGRVPGERQIVKAFGLAPEDARGLRKQALALLKAQSLPPETPNGQADLANAQPGAVPDRGNDRPAAAGEDQAGSAIPANPRDREGTQDDTGNRDLASGAAEPAVAGEAAGSQAQGLSYDESPDLLDTDITPPSGGAFENRGAAELQAKRHDGGRVFEVDGGYVVRVPRAAAAAESDATATPASTNTSDSSALPRADAPASQPDTAPVPGTDESPTAAGQPSATPAVVGESTASQEATPPAAGDQAENPVVAVAGGATPASGAEGAPGSGEQSVEGISQAEHDRIAALPANQRTDAEIAAANAFSREQKRPAQEAAAAAEKAKQDALNDTDGFADNLPPMQRQKKIDALNRSVRVKGGVITRKQHIRDMVARGARVGMTKEGRALIHAGGSYTLEKDLSKTALDYAEHLTKQTAATPKAKPSGSLAAVKKGSATEVIAPTPAFDTAKMLREFPVGHVATVEGERTAEHPDGAVRWTKQANDTWTDGRSTITTDRLAKMVDEAPEAPAIDARRSNVLEGQSRRIETQKALPAPAANKAEGQSGNRPEIPDSSFSNATGQPTPKSEKAAAAPKGVGKAAGNLGNTEDAGEELWANRRHSSGKGLSWNDIAGLNATLKAREAVKAKVWPRPDYAALIEGGIPKPVAHIIKQVYDSIAAKPATRGAPTDQQYQDYIAGVQKVRDAAFDWARKVMAQPGLETLENRVAAAPNSFQASNIVEAFFGLGNRMNAPMLDAVLPKPAGPIETAHRFRTGEQGKANNALALLLGGNKFVKALQPGSTAASKAMKDIGKGWPAPQEAWEKSYSIRARESDFLVVKRDGRHHLEIVGEPHKTHEEAVAAAREAYAQARKKGGDGAKAEAPVALRDARSGPERRSANEDITSDKLKETFGFKGVNFGNWMKGSAAKNVAERQAHLNHAYDSFMDLAELLGIPPKAISLNGMLGVAFGAQGTGGKRAAAAHFIPGINEINLTREQGAGSLAHEWAHALDHYFATKAGGRIATAKEPFLTEHADSATDGVRPEIVAAFKAIVQAMRKRPETAEEAAARAKANGSSARRGLDIRLKSLRARLENDKLKSGDRAALLADFDALAERLRQGDVGEGYLRTGKGRMDAAPQVVAMVANLYREALGHKADNIENLGYLARSLAAANNAQDSDKAHVPQQVTSDFAKEAMKLEGTRKTPYWTTKLEMFARAFQSYVMDKLDQQGARNDYLTRPQMTPEQRERMLADPIGQMLVESGDRYPRGAERERINAAFDTLVADLKTRETGNGNVALENTDQAQELTSDDLTPAERASFASQIEQRDANAAERELAAQMSREEGEADAEKYGLKKAVLRILGPTGLRVQFLRDMNGLPDDVKADIESRDQSGRSVRNVALYDPTSRQMYVFTGRVRDPWRAAWHAAHELAGHDGLRALLGKNLDKALRLAGENPTVRRIAAAIYAERDYAGRVASGQKSAEGARLESIEEALAELAAAVRTEDYGQIESRYGVTVPTGIRAKVQAVIDEFLRRLKNLLNRQAGRDAFTDADVRALLEHAWTAAKGENAAVGDIAEQAESGTIGGVSDKTAKAVGMANDAIRQINGRDFDGEQIAPLRSLRDLDSLPDDVRSEVFGEAVAGWFEASGLTAKLTASNGHSHYYLIRDPGTFVAATVRFSDHENLSRSSRNAPPDVNIVDGDFGDSINKIADALDQSAIDDGEDFKSPRYEPGPESNTADPNVRALSTDRTALQAEAKALGLPAAGATDKIANLVRIAKADPSSWSRQDFDTILPHLSIHQDVRDGSTERVAAVMERGLDSGMVDPASGLEPGSKDWSWAKGYSGGDVYAFIGGALKFKGRDNPRLAPGNKPLFHAKPDKGGSLFDAIRARTAVEGEGATVGGMAENTVADQTQTAASDEINDKPVRRGDMFRYDATRVATVMEAMPGGRVFIRIQGLRNGKPSMMVGEETTKSLKALPRMGKAEFLDGTIITPQSVIDAVTGKAARANPSILESVEPLSTHLGNALNSARGVRLPAGYLLSDIMGKTQGGLHWWHKTVGTMFNLAQRYPSFKRVFDSVQAFIDDTSFFASEAANLAPRLLPKLEGWKDVFKQPVSAADTKAIAAPIFQGTLSWTRDEDGKAVPADSVETAGIVWTDEELRGQWKLNDGQIALYREFRAAADKSLNDLFVAQMVNYAGEDASPIRRQVLDAGTVDEVGRQLAKYLRDQVRDLGEVNANLKGRINRLGEAAASSDQVKRMKGEMEANFGRATSLQSTAKWLDEQTERFHSLTQKGYAPLSRFGRHVVYVRTKEGEQVFFGMYDTSREASRAARQFTGDNEFVERGTMSQEAFKLFNGITPETLELFGDMLGLDTESTNAADQAFQEFLRLTKSNRSALKRLIHRKGVAGFSEDAGRVLASFIYSNARLASSALHNNETTQALASIPREQGELKDVAIQLADYIKNPQEEAHAIRAFTFAQYLGGSIAAAMVNMTQSITMTFPYLSQYGGAVAAARELKSAVHDALKRTTGDAALDRAIRMGEEDGFLAPQEVHQLMAQARGAATLQAGDGSRAGDVYAKTQNALAKTGLAWGKVFSVAEAFNRRTAFIAAYRLAQQQGIADPAGFARNAVEQTQGIYNKANKPRWARGAMGSTLFTFKQFSISYVEMLHRMATRGGPEGRKAALLALGVMFLMSGAGGLPGADDLDDLIDGLLQRLGYNVSTKQQRLELFAKAFGQGGAQFMERGLSGLPGVPIDVAGRLGMGNLIPGTGLLTKKEDHSRDLTEIVGPVGDLATRAGQAANLAAEGSFGKAMLAISPTAVRNVAQGIDMATTGMYRDKKGRKVIDTTGYEALAKAIGYQPNTVARVQQASYEVYSLIAVNKMVEREIADQWAQGLFEKDTGKVQDARDQLARWNARNPDTPIRINRRQIEGRLRAMLLGKNERIARTAPKEIRNSVTRGLVAPE